MGLWTTYVAIANWAANRLVASDGAPPTGQQWRVTQEDIYDRLEYLYERREPAVSAIQRWQALPDWDYLEAEWTPITADAHLSQVAAGTDFFTSRLDVPHGATITDITAWVKGAPGHAALPARMPRWQLCTRGSGASFGTVATRIDSSSNTTNYEAVHGISLNPSHVVDRSAGALFLRFEGESGANSLAGLEVYSIRVLFTSPTQRDPGVA